VLKLIVVSIVSLSTCLFFNFGSCSGQDKKASLSKASESAAQSTESNVAALLEQLQPNMMVVDGEYTYTLTWQEPFANAIPLKQNIRVKVIPDKNKHGVVFVCGSPQPFGSEVWTELLKIRAAFE
jgi:hypothetical protein